MDRLEFRISQLNFGFKGFILEYHWFDCKISLCNFGFQLWEPKRRLCKGVVGRAGSPWQHRWQAAPMGLCFAPRGRTGGTRPGGSHGHIAYADVPNGRLRWHRVGMLGPDGLATMWTGLGQGPARPGPLPNRGTDSGVQFRILEVSI